MQASRVVGYINNEGHLLVDVPLSLPPGQVEVIVLSEKAKSLQESAIKETSAQTSYISEQFMPEKNDLREKSNQQLVEECRQLASMNFDDIGTDEEWTRVQNEALLALEKERTEEEDSESS